MRASRQPPSMMELCEIFRKRKEIMLNPDQPVSELEETPHAVRSPCITPIAVDEHAVETLESGRDPSFRSMRTRRSTKTYERLISSSKTEEEEDFGFTEKRNDLKFSPVETPTEFYEREAVESSLDEVFYDFDDGVARTDLLQNRQVCRMKARNAELRRTAYHEMCLTQIDVEKIRRKGIVQRGIYSANQSHCHAIYLHNQVNPRQFSHCQASRSPNTNTRGAYLPQQVQARNEKRTSRQTIRSPIYLQQNMLNKQLEETDQAKRKNECSNRSVTTLPPIQRRAMVTRPHQSSHRTEEQPSQLLAPGRRCGQQKVCEDRRSEYCKNRRIGVCKETDTTQEHRTFFRVLQKRF